jgi:hypothetical protein
MHAVAAELPWRELLARSPSYRGHLVNCLHTTMTEHPRCEMLAKQILATDLFSQAACARSWLSFLAATFAKGSLSRSQIAHTNLTMSKARGSDPRAPISTCLDTRVSWSVFPDLKCESRPHGRVPAGRPPAGGPPAALLDLLPDPGRWRTRAASSPGQGVEHGHALDL